MTGASLMKPLTFAACAAVVAALAGCASSSSTNPLAEHTLHGTLTCQSVLVSGNTLANEVSTLFTDNQAISGQWANAEAATMGANTTPTAAQNQAITDLLAHAERPGHRNWSHGQPRPRCRFAGQQREQAHERRVRLAVRRPRRQLRHHHPEQDLRRGRDRLIPPGLNQAPVAHHRLDAEHRGAAFDLCAAGGLILR